MQQLLTKLFEPILRLFDDGQEPTNYKASHRKALNVLGMLFIFLSCVSAATGYYAGSIISAMIPILAFFLVGLFALVIGFLGSNAAVCKIWGTK